MQKHSVLVADDHHHLREYIVEWLLNNHFDVVASVSDGNEAVKAAEERRPSVALLDVSMPVMNGFQAARKILDRHPTCKIVFVSNRKRPPYIKAARVLGAHGYVAKSNLQDELVNAIESALKGEFYDSRTSTSDRE